MRVLVLWAQPRQANFGVRVLAEGTASWLRAAFGDEVEVRFHGTGRPGDFNDGPVNIGHVKPLIRRWATRDGELIDWLRSFDLIVDTRAGDSFSDIYGLKRQIKMTPITIMASRLGIPVVLGPQTIGPFTNSRARLLAKLSLRSARLVFARDHVSASRADRLGRPADAVTTDVAFALDRPAPAATKRDVLLNVSGLLLQPNPHVDHAQYRLLIEDLTEQLRKSGRDVALLVHVVGPEHGTGDNDWYAAKALKSDFDDADVLVPTELTELRSIIGAARLVIGSRMHACLNAMSMGVPAISIAYSEKFVPLFADLGWDHSFDMRTSVRPHEIVRAASDVSSLEAGALRAGERAGELIASSITKLRTV